jgi:1-deoxy-D-xylulose-5-phosphate reductoisomerase
VLAVPDDRSAADLRTRLAYESCEILTGEEGLCRLASLGEADMVLVAIVGTGGLRPTLAALEAGKDIALASKEVLVVAGELVMAAAASRGCRILPVDSEHNAIFQCLEGHEPAHVKKLILTASGGPFRTWPEDKLRAVTREEALRHPTWRMGEKITVDSATLFNKGLEMIEARWLFGVGIDRIDVVIHPQSIVHSMVEFVDGSVLAQLSHSDMRFPIQYAFTWPERLAGSLPPLEFAKLGRLDFEEPRRDVFPALDLARQAAERGGALPAVLNAANEVAVAEFLASRIAFPRIWDIVASVMEQTPDRPASDLGALLEADHAARESARRLAAA